MHKTALVGAALLCVMARMTAAFAPTAAWRANYARLPLKTCSMSAEVGMGPGGQQGTASGPGSWQKLSQRVFENDQRPVILYDGVCNLCNGGVNFMLDFDKPDDPKGTFRFAALQSEVGKALLQRGGRASDDISSIVLATHDGKTYTESEAILRIGQGLGGGTPLWPWAPVASRLALWVVPEFVRDKVYELISENRYQFFGQSDECRLWDDRFDERFIPDIPDATEA